MELSKPGGKTDMQKKLQQESGMKHFMGITRECYVVIDKSEVDALLMKKPLVNDSPVKTVNPPQASLQVQSTAPLLGTDCSNCAFCHEVFFNSDDLRCHMDKCEPINNFYSAWDYPFKCVESSRANVDFLFIVESQDSYCREIPPSRVDVLMRNDVEAAPESDHERKREEIIRSPLHRGAEDTKHSFLRTTEDLEGDEVTCWGRVKRDRPGSGGITLPCSLSLDRLFGESVGERPSNALMSMWLQAETAADLGNTRIGGIGQPPDGISDSKLTSTVSHAPSTHENKVQCQEKDGIARSKPFSCNVCGKAFRWKHHRAKHMIVHRTPPSGLDRHTEMNKVQLCQEKDGTARSKPFSCNVCGKAFRWKNHRAKHMIVHRTPPSGLDRHTEMNKVQCQEKDGTARSKPFSCNVCGKAFRWKHHRAKHMIVHRTPPSGFDRDTDRFSRSAFQLRPQLAAESEVKPLHCDSQQAVALLGGDAHSVGEGGGGPPESYVPGDSAGGLPPVAGVSSTDDVTIPRPNDSKKRRKKFKRGTGARGLFSCSFCYKVFRVEANMKMHESSHTRKEPLSCPVCRHLFTNPLSLNFHMKNTCKGKGCLCKKCTERGSIPIRERALATAAKIKRRAQRTALHNCYCLQRKVPALLKRRFPCRWCPIQQRQEHEHPLSRSRSSPPSHSQAPVLRGKRPVSVAVSNVAADAPAADWELNDEAELAEIPLAFFHQQADQPHKCPLCPATFGLRVFLESHSRIHLRRAYVCPICRQSFSEHLSRTVHFLQNH